MESVKRCSAVSPMTNDKHGFRCSVLSAFKDVIVSLLVMVLLKRATYSPALLTDTGSGIECYSSATPHQAAIPTRGAIDAS